MFDNMHFWLNRIPSMADAIRMKMEEKGCYFPPGDFPFFGFIDNTMNATCRPGGGPTRDGINAPRNNPEIQRAWYNGWKKFHGMKWQTIDLPNGLNFKVDVHLRLYSPERSRNHEWMQYFSVLQLFSTYV